MALSTIIKEQQDRQPAPKGLQTPDQFLNGGVRSISFGRVGDTKMLEVWVEGTVVGETEVNQQSDYDTGELLFWSSEGKPVMDNGGGRYNPVQQMIITLQTEAQEDEDDDGLRKLYIKTGEQKKALKAALAEAGVRGIKEGGRLRFRWTGERPSKNPKFGMARLYEAEYTPPEAVEVAVPED